VLRIRIQSDPYIIDSSGSGSVYCQSGGSGSGSVYIIYGSATQVKTVFRIRHIILDPDPTQWLYLPTCLLTYRTNFYFYKIRLTMSKIGFDHVQNASEFLLSSANAVSAAVYCTAVFSCWCYLQLYWYFSTIWLSLNFGFSLVSSFFCFSFVQVPAKHSWVTVL